MSTMGSPMSLDPPFEPDRFVCDRVVTQEARTGREVWQVTSGEGESVSPYMDCVAWSSDDRFLVVNCNRTGSWQPYRLEIDTGEMVQLCQVELGAYRSVALALGNDTAYCADGARVWAVELDTLAVREAVCCAGRTRPSSNPARTGETPICRRIRIRTSIPTSAAPVVWSPTIPISQEGLKCIGSYF